MGKNSQYLLIGALLGLINQPCLAVKEAAPGEDFFLEYSQAVKEEKLGNNLQAVKKYKISNEIKGRDFAALTKLGLMHLYSDSSGEVKDKSLILAVDYLTKAQSIKPGDSMVNLLLGRAYQEQGDLTNAVKYLTKASTLEPNNVLIKSSLGRLYFEQKDFKKAIEIFNKIVFSYPDNLSARSYLGASLQSTDNYLAAIEQYNYVLEYQPTAYSLRKNLGDCWLALKQYDKAKESYEGARDLDPNVPNIYADIAYVAKEEGDLGAAVTNFRKALSLKQDEKWKRSLAYALWNNQQIPEAITVFNEIQEYSISAYLYQGLGDMSNATTSYQKAIETNPKDTKSRFNLAHLYYEGKQFDQAKAEYEKLLEQKPNDVEVIFLLAVLEQERGNVNVAMKYYNNLLNDYLIADKGKELDENNKLIKNNIYYNLGLAYKTNQDYQKAEANFEELLKKETKSDKFEKTRDVYKELSFIKIALGKDIEAEKLINNWLKSDPTNVEARNLYADFLVHVSKERKAIEQLRLASVLDQTVKTRLKLANLLHSQNNLYEALAEYQSVLQVEPENLNALLGAANNFKTLGFKDEAVNIYKEAAEKHPDDVLANFNYGLLMQEANNLDVAKQHYEKVLAKNPNFLQTYYVLGLVYWDQGQKDKANELWDKFLTQSSDEALKSEIRRLLGTTGAGTEPKPVKIDLVNPKSIDQLTIHKEYAGQEKT
jgi:tetratricopeptide (TPR) repeat protein